MLAYFRMNINHLTDNLVVEITNVHPWNSFFFVQLLFSLQHQFNVQLLEFFIAVVDAKLLKTVKRILYRSTSDMYFVANLFTPKTSNPYMSITLIAVCLIPLVAWTSTAVLIRFTTSWNSLSYIIYSEIAISTTAKREISIVYLGQGITSIGCLSYLLWSGYHLSFGSNNSDC